MFQMTPLAPIVLFTYKRLDTLIQTVEALQKNKLASDSDLFVFSDAAKTENDKQAIAEVRSFLKSITGFKSVTINEAVKNKGLAKSIINGVSKVLEDYDKVIVLEDDLKTSSNFLDFMNLALDKYENEAKVYSVSGYGLKVLVPKNYEFDTYFTPRGMSWGWATWRDRWCNVDWNVSDFDSFKVNKEEKSKFAIGGTDLNAMLKKQMDGEIDSWAIRWYYDQFKNDKLTVFPIQSKVINLGFDELATHTNAYNRYTVLFDKSNTRSFLFPSDIIINEVIFNSFKGYFSFFKRIFFGRIISPLYRFYFSILKKI